jgi:beta-N-acetylhexosaminidase
MIGQMIVVGFVGTKSSDPGVVAVKDQLGKGVIGGVMLLERNVRSSQQVLALNAGIRRAAGNTMPLISVDQEGGAVQRLNPRSGHRRFPSPSQVGKAGGADPGGRALSLYKVMASELKAHGFNVNFGPNVDLNINPNNPVIGKLGRSFGADPHHVLKFAAIFNLAHKQANILTAAKHFPGHGSSRTDSHVDFTDISKTWKPIELTPFASIADDVDMIMVGHLYHPRFSDGPGIPASLSQKATDYLRNRIGFKGVIVSDDMEMGALRQHFSFEDRIVRAVAAGTDLLVFANRIAPDDDLGRHIHAAILRAVRTGTIPVKRIEESYRRIILMKRTLGAVDSAAK